MYQNVLIFFRSSRFDSFLEKNDLISVVLTLQLHCIQISNFEGLE
jgi:hypothetical protein